MPKAKSVLIYAHSKLGKTSNLYFLAKNLVWKRWGMKTRLITCDGGGWGPFEDGGLIGDPNYPAMAGGIVEAVDFSSRPKALADIHKIGNGYWPLYGSKTKKETLASEDRYMTIKDSSGWATQGGTKVMSHDGTSQIGCYMFEGATSLANLWLNHCSNQEGGVGFKESWSYQEDDLTIRGLQEGHYGIVQKEMYKFIVHELEKLPVKLIVMTALVGSSEDKYNKITKFGPQGAGKADTLKMPSWFQTTLHIDKVQEEKDDKIIERRVAYFEEHRDKDTGITCLAGSGVTPELYPRLKERYPGGYVPLGFKSGVDKYFITLEELGEEFRQSQSQSQQQLTTKENI